MKTRLLEEILTKIKEDNERVGTVMSIDDSNERVLNILREFDLEDNDEMLEESFGADYQLIREYEAGCYEDTKKEIGLREIKKSVLADGGTFEKENIRLNGNDAYRVNGKLYTKYELIESYKMGDL